MVFHSNATTGLYEDTRGTRFYRASLDPSHDQMRSAFQPSMRYLSLHHYSASSSASVPPTSYRQLPGESIALSSKQHSHRSAYHLRGLGALSRQLPDDFLHRRGERAVGHAMERGPRKPRARDDATHVTRPTRAITETTRRTI